MGLFDFVKDLGKKLFSSEAEAAEKIEQSISAENPGVDDLAVSFDDGIVSLSGKTATPEAMEKAVLMAGNVQGITEVKIEGLDAPEVTLEVEYYTIVSGDSLSKIAKNFYGNAMDYPKLFEANREVIKDPDLIYPGQKIRVPPKTW